MAMGPRTRVVEALVGSSPTDGHREVSVFLFALCCYFVG